MIFLFLRMFYNKNKSMGRRVWPNYLSIIEKKQQVVGLFMSSTVSWMCLSSTAGLHIKAYVSQADGISPNTSLKSWQKKCFKNKIKGLPWIEANLHPKRFVEHTYLQSAKKEQVMYAATVKNLYAVQALRGPAQSALNEIQTQIYENISHECHIFLFVIIT